LDIILPVQDILAAYPLVPASLDGSLDAVLDSWKSGTEAIFLWLNILLFMREDGILNKELRSPGMISAAAQSLPNYGSGVKVLFWAAAARKLADLRVTEKKKEISLIPVMYNLSL
jgi:hypothetical protein